MYKVAALFAVTAVVLGVVFGQTVQASHPQPDVDGVSPDFNYLWTHHHLYPGTSGQITWKAWTINATDVPLRDAVILIQVVDLTWELGFAYALVSGGYRPFDFAGVGHHASANVSYARMDNNTQMLWFCGSSIAVACFLRDVVLDPDPNQGFATVDRASIVYGPHVWSDPDANFAKHVSHEWGHGFGLAHEGQAPPCVTVMTQGECTNGPVAADIGTALSTVYGY